MKKNWKKIFFLKLKKEFKEKNWMKNWAYFVIDGSYKLKLQWARDLGVLTLFNNTQEKKSRTKQIEMEKRR